jgi:hypothetical protein
LGDDQDGELLALAGGQFEVFVTLDRNLSFQQNLVTYSIAVIVLGAKSNRLVDLKPLIPKLGAAIESARTGVVAYIDADQAVSSSARKVPHAAASPFISDVRDDRIIGFRGDSACGYSAAGECTMVGGAGGPL